MRVIRPGINRVGDRLGDLRQVKLLNDPPDPKTLNTSPWLHTDNNSVNTTGTSKSVSTVSILSAL